MVGYLAGQDPTTRRLLEEILASEEEHAEDLSSLLEELFEPTGVSPPMGLVRIGTGRDAADVSFATMFGASKSSPPVIVIGAVNDPENGFTLPRLCPEAVSTHGEFAKVQYGGGAEYRWRTCRNTRKSAPTYASVQTAWFRRNTLVASPDGLQEIDMNRDRFEGNLKQLGGKVQEQWGRLTHDPQREFTGRRDQLAGRIQERYGISKEEAARQLKDFVDRNRNWNLSAR